MATVDVVVVALLVVPDVHGIEVPLSLPGVLGSVAPGSKAFAVHSASPDVLEA